MWCKKLFQRAIGGVSRQSERGQAPGIGADIVHVGDRRRFRRFDRPLHQARNQPVQQSPQHFLKLFALGSAGELRFHFLPAAAEFGNPLAHFFDLEKAGGEAVVQIGRVVSDLIRQVDQLGFQRRAQSGKIFVQRRILALFEIVRMLDDALAYFEGQVQAGKAGIAALERFDDPQGVKIMIEAIAKAAHLAIQLVFAGVRERRMADVVAQRQSFGESSLRSSAAATVRAICATSMVWVSRLRKWSEMPGGKNLRLILQAPKSPRVDNAVAIALELTAVRMRQFGISAAAASLDGKTQAAQFMPRSPRPVHFWDRELAKVMAALLTALRVLVRSGLHQFPGALAGRWS